MYHISDCKKFSRCPRLFLLDQQAVKPEYHPFVRLDETVTDLAAKKLHLDSYYLGSRGDAPEKALAALSEYEWLVKARFEYDGLRVKVPFLHIVKDGWDLYFLFVGLYPHAEDMQFYNDTLWVLEKNGLNIQKIRILHLNGNYVRHGKLDCEKLFVISDCFYNDKNHPTIDIKKAMLKKKKDLTEMLKAMKSVTLESLGEPVRLARCATRQKCRFYDQCFVQETTQPCDSILTLAASRYRYEMAKEGKTKLKEADINRIEGSRQQYAQIMADKNGGLFFDQMAVKTWLKKLTYPLIFLDFEWERYAIPPYDGMKPYDVLPFEYSIHRLEKDGTLTHSVFLSTQDDRLEMVEGLLKDIPSQGTIIAYNALGAETIRIQELAQQFPNHAKRLLQMNERMQDLQLPFTGGLVYDTRMNGLYSLKQIMSMMDDPGYKDLEIHQGMDAVFQWRHLDRQDASVDSKKITEELKAYCGMDSYAMVVVYRWLCQTCGQSK